MAFPRSGDRPRDREIGFRGLGPENYSKDSLSKDGPAQVGISAYINLRGATDLLLLRRLLEALGDLGGQGNGWGRHG